MKMRTTTLGVLVVLALVALTTGVVTAHENGGDTGNGMPTNATASEWATWMNQQMTEHMGAEATAQMQNRMGITTDQMGAHMIKMMDSRMMQSQMMNENTSASGCH